jgi:hypothetical protein
MWTETEQNFQRITYYGNALAVFAPHVLPVVNAGGDVYFHYDDQGLYLSSRSLVSLLETERSANLVPSLATRGNPLVQRDNKVSRQGVQVVKWLYAGARSDKFGTFAFCLGPTMPLPIVADGFVSCSNG